MGLILTLALIDSKFVLPTRNEFGYFWYIIGLSFIIYEKALNQNKVGLFYNMSKIFSDFRFKIYNRPHT